MSQPTCPTCRGVLAQTKVLRFPEGAPKLVFECPTCQKATIYEERTS